MMLRTVGWTWVWTAIALLSVFAGLLLLSKQRRVMALGVAIMLALTVAVVAPAIYEDCFVWWPLCEILR